MKGASSKVRQRPVERGVRLHDSTVTKSVLPKSRIFAAGFSMNCLSLCRENYDEHCQSYQQRWNTGMELENEELGRLTELSEEEGFAT